MESMFSDKYYNDDENVKPVFDDDIDTADYENSDDEASGAEEAGEEDAQEEEAAEEEQAHEDYDGYEGEEGYYDENEYYGEGGDEEDIMMDADYLPGGENFGKAPKKETKKEKAKREKEEKKLAKQARSDGIRTATAALNAAKSTLDQDKKKDFNSYLDEYYQLDYEDMVSPRIEKQQKSTNCVDCTLKRYFTFLFLFLGWRLAHPLQIPQGQALELRSDSRRDLAGGR